MREISPVVLSSNPALGISTSFWHKPATILLAFTDKATTKLKEVANTLLRSEERQKPKEETTEETEEGKKAGNGKK
jgi:hypothetical protein